MVFYVYRPSKKANGLARLVFSIIVLIAVRVVILEIKQSNLNSLPKYDSSDVVGIVPSVPATNSLPPDASRPLSPVDVNKSSQGRDETKHEVSSKGNEASVIASFAAVAVAAVSVYISYQSLRVQWINANTAVKKNFEDQFSKASEQLANDAVEVRLAGVLAFIRIAENYPEHYQEVMTSLNTFIYKYEYHVKQAGKELFEYSKCPKDIELAFNFTRSKPISRFTDSL